VSTIWPKRRQVGFSVHFFDTLVIHENYTKNTRHLPFLCSNWYQCLHRRYTKNTPKIHVFFVYFSCISPVFRVYQKSALKDPTCKWMGLTLIKYLSILLKLLRINRGISTEIPTWNWFEAQIRPLFLIEFFMYLLCIFHVLLVYFSCIPRVYQRTKWSYLLEA
jgi:hypothetical protein